RDTAGLSSSATATVTVADASPVAALTVTPTSGISPLQVTADASGSTDPDATPIVAYRFDFGDGGSVQQSGAVATHAYSTAGSYALTVTAIDSANNTGSTSKTTLVDALSASLRIQPAFGTAPLNVTADG